MDKLLKLLSENSGFTTAEIAAMLGEPEDYIKAQIKEYENSGVIKGYQAVVNWDMVDDSYVEALIELQVTPKKETGFDEMAELCMGKISALTILQYVNFINDKPIGRIKYALN